MNQPINESIIVLTDQSSIKDDCLEAGRLFQKRMEMAVIEMEVDKQARPTPQSHKHSSPIRHHSHPDSRHTQPCSRARHHSCAHPNFQNHTFNPRDQYR